VHILTLKHRRRFFILRHSELLDHFDWTQSFGLLNLASFARDPLDHQGGIVLGEEVVVQILLSEKGADEVFERYQSVLLLLVVDDLELFQLSEHAKYLKESQIWVTYIFEVILTQLKASCTPGIRISTWLLCVGKRSGNVLLLGSLRGLDVESKRGVLGWKVVLLEDLHDAIKLLLSQVELLLLVKAGLGVRLLPCLCRLWC